MKNCKKILKNFIITVLVIYLVIYGMGNNDIVRASENQWVTEDFELPVALRGTCVEYVDGKMYVIGGDKGYMDIVNTILIYDFKTKVWTSGATMSYPRLQACSIVIENKIYVIGGQFSSNSKWVAHNSIEVYDIATDTWSLGATMPLNTSSADAIQYNGKIYVFGGVSYNNGILTTPYKTIQIYDIATNIWSSEETLPFLRYGHVLEIIDDNVYLIGGYNGSKACDDINIYNLNTKKWTYGSLFEHGRQQFDSIVHNNRIYILGGYNGSTFLNSVEIYDIVTDKWNRGNNLMKAKRLATTINVNNKIYAFGGDIILNPTTSTNAIESLQLPPSDNRLFAHLYINEKTQLSFSHDLAHNQSLTWKSSTPRVATVDLDGMVNAFEVGTTYISAYNQNGTLVDYIPVIVTESDVYRMAVQLNTGQTQKLYMSGNPNRVTWSSMDNTVATVDNNGLVTGISKGLVIVKASLNGEEYYIYVRVN